MQISRYRRWPLCVFNTKSARLEATAAGPGLEVWGRRPRSGRRRQTWPGNAEAVDIALKPRLAVWSAVCGLRRAKCPASAVSSGEVRAQRSDICRNHMGRRLRPQKPLTRVTISRAQNERRHLAWLSERCRSTRRSCSDCENEAVCSQPPPHPLGTGVRMALQDHGGGDMSGRALLSSRFCLCFSEISPPSVERPPLSNFLGRYQTFA